ncbi:hypothetical protein GTP46_02305 [Duganella sp. FT135W]|uniref:NACHT domain-containing protein n=2 Tax=Duganella flavida TaxID=2692175 RepID=A0A6L8K5N3_9BURK|nr:hypothetical protein [Duganella flavida]
MINDKGQEETRQTIRIDKLRASKAGHAFHEAWAARTALELLPPLTSLTAITLEGLDIEDEKTLGDDAVEIADLVRYYGATDIAHARQVVVVQFKYSIAKADSPVRAVDFEQTLRKFAITDAQLRTQHGDEHVLSVVKYEFATNRPVHENLDRALSMLISGGEMSGDLKSQADRIRLALAAYSFPIAELLRRVDLVGGKGTLKQAEHSVATMLASWSEPSDPDAEKRLLKLRSLVRDKAGPGSETDKRIDRISVLAELGVDHEDRLYPTPDAFPYVDVVVQRAVLDDLVACARTVGAPVVVHAAGGMGKTVLMQGLAERLSNDGPVVLFDGFGAGRWRDPADGRHLPERTLVHLANLLAGDGLCDILLPLSDITGLVRAFRRRIIQAVGTARSVRAGASVSLILDAIDHAAIAAIETATSSFAHLLLRSLTADPIEGVRVIVSCRTERLELAVGGMLYRPFSIPLFTEVEIRTLVAKRIPDASSVEVASLSMRSGRNPRCLDSLITTGRPFDLWASPDALGEPNELLDTLLRKRLADAREAARIRGASDRDIDLLLAGVALLSPPVPIEELAAAHEMIAEQVESFVADLYPLIERTPHGLMFRDEPTETLIRKNYGNDQAARDQIVKILQERQVESTYAARALPGLLTSLRYADQLIELAYDLRVPSGVSLVSIREIRLSRITAAIVLTAEREKFDDLWRLFMEASLVAAGHERSDRLLYEYPDLAAISDDPDALRRLSMTKTGWPGGKHAALAIATSFMGNYEEAHRHARRSIDWFNWSVQKKRNIGERQSNVSNYFDDVGFAYVAMLTGSDFKVAKFFSSRGEGASFLKFRDLFDLLDRHRHSPHPPVMQMEARLSRCRLSVRSLYAAALYFTNQTDPHTKKILKVLAKAPSAMEKSAGLSAACIFAAARAAGLGMDVEARSILSGTVLKLESVYDYSTAYPLDSAIHVSVLAAGISAALSGRQAALIDFLPNELVELVPPSARSRGNSACIAALKEKLTARTYDGKRLRRKRKALNEETRSSYSRAFDSRIFPLLIYAQHVAFIIRPPLGKKRCEMLTEAINQLRRDVDKASNYPYRDGKAYAARTGLRIIFDIADALGALDEIVTKSLVDWIISVPGIYTPELIYLITRLSRDPKCLDAALDLAAHADAQIQHDTDVSSRVNSYGDLARAVWRVGVEEAAAYFKQGLDLAGAIGSDDFHRTNHLLAIAGRYCGPELPAEASHTLARILELNQHEDGKFPWIEYAQAMVPTSGLATLAKLARQDDRGAARFGLSLGPALTVLVRNSKLSAETAAALLGLASPVETWTWSLSDFASEIVGRLNPIRKEWFFKLLLIEIDRQDQLSPSKNTIDGLAKLAVENLAPDSTSLSRIKALQRRLQSDSELSTTALPVDTQQASTLYPVDFSDPDEIDRQILSRGEGDKERPWPAQILSRMANQISTPSDRLRYVRAVVEISAATLADKIRALDDYLPEWERSSRAMRDELPTLGLRLAKKHAAELAGSDYEASIGWTGIEQYFHSSPKSLVQQAVMALRDSAENLSGDSWLLLASKLASEVSPQAFATGLERFLTNTGEKLPNEVGDGPWRVGFQVAADEATFLASLLWARLGHPVASMRWRAAHAVRRLVAIERFDVVDALLTRFKFDSGLPCADAKLPFYAMHAQLWLLISCARIAKDSAQGFVKHRPIFEEIAFSTTFPHVVARAFAMDVLRKLEPLIGDDERVLLRSKLSVANRSPFSPITRTELGELCYRARPDSRPEEDSAFRLEYDFNKYQVARLCRVFSCPGWEVSDRINVWVKRWDNKIGSMYECPRSGNDDYESGSSSSVPARDRYGGYLGWHALMLVAGELLATRAIVDDPWDKEVWAHFLGSYTLSRDDGEWISDLTDLFPIDIADVAELPMPEPGQASTLREDRRLLLPLLGVSDGIAIGENLLVSGRCSPGSGLTLTVQSVIANDHDAKATAMAWLSADQTFRWLPHDKSEIARHFGRQGHTVRPWLEGMENAEYNLDQHDSYGASSALDRPFPARWTQKKLGLIQRDPVVRSWRIEDSPAYFAQAWGAEGGRGEYAWSKTGSRLFVTKDALLTLLQSCRRTLVLSILIRKYYSAKSDGHSGDSGSFSYRSLIIVVKENGEIWVPRGISADAKKAIAVLSTDRQRDFYPRFRAIAGLPDEWELKRSERQFTAVQIQMLNKLYGSGE